MNNIIIKFIISIITNIGLKPDELIFDTEPSIVVPLSPLYPKNLKYYFYIIFCTNLIATLIAIQHSLSYILFSQNR